MQIAVAVAMLALGLPIAAVTQDGVLRITVVLTDADGNVTPIPRVVLLVSDNPASGEPRRVRTGADGAVEITLGPETTPWSPSPGHARRAVLRVDADDRRHSWQRRAVIDAGQCGNQCCYRSHLRRWLRRRCAGARRFRRHLQQMARQRCRDLDGDGHASGFLIDARGLIATSEPGVRDANAVEVEFSLRLGGDDKSVPRRSGQAADRFKIPGRVIAFDKHMGVAIIWVDPAAVSSIPAIGLIAAPPKAQR